MVLKASSASSATTRLYRFELLPPLGFLLLYLGVASFGLEAAWAICLLRRTLPGTRERERKLWLIGIHPTNVAGVHLVTGCPNASAGVKIVGGKKRNP